MTCPDTRVSISVLIPAFNEAKNIGRMLDDVYAQDLAGRIELEQVIVVSDGSTDATEAAVLDRCADHSSLALLVNEARLGKAACINAGKAMVSSDFLVLVDADVRLAGESTLAGLIGDPEQEVGMTGGVPVPADDTRGLAPMIFICGDILRDYIRRNLKGGSNIYSAHGRILALSRELYEQVEIPSLEAGSRVLSTDQFLYYSCVKAGKRFVLMPEAKVLFKLPDSFKDYLLVTVRFMYSSNNTTEFFHDRGIGSEFYVPLKLKVKAMVHLISQKPFGAVAWVAYRMAARGIYIYKRYVRREEVPAAWPVSESTKESIEAR